MFKYALLDYVPKRYLRRASFDTQENDRFILDFKAGRRYATDKASRLIHFSIVIKGNLPYAI